MRPGWCATTGAHQSPDRLTPVRPPRARGDLLHRQGTRGAPEPTRSRGRVPFEGAPPLDNAGLPAGEDFSSNSANLREKAGVPPLGNPEGPNGGMPTGETRRDTTRRLALARQWSRLAQAGVRLKSSKD